MRIHQLSEAEALASLGSAADGLSFAEARRRLDEFGPNRVEEVRREYRAERTLALLRKLLPQEIATVREGKVVQLSSEGLVPGDIVLLEQGDRVPADCRLIEAFGVRVDDAAITGESLPRTRVAALADGGDAIHGKVVFATGMHTEFGRISSSCGSRWTRPRSSSPACGRTRSDGSSMR